MGLVELIQHAAEEAIMMLSTITPTSKVYGISPEPLPFLDKRLAVEEMLWE